MPEGGADGVIIAQGGRFGGWSVYVEGGTATFVYNVLGIQHFTVAADRADPGGHPPGAHGVRVRRRRPREGRRRHARTTTATPSAPVGSGMTQPMIFSADETTDVGYESGTAVSPDYTPQSSRFTGRINWVQLDVGTDDNDHFIDPDERLRVAMARQ